MTEDLKENIIHNYTQDHPTSIHVVSDQNIDGKIENFENSINFKIKFQLIVPNMTSKPRNADFIVKKGILSNYPTHLFKDMAIIRLYSKYQLEVILKQYYNANPYYFINLNLGDNLKINDIISK